MESIIIINNPLLKGIFDLNDKVDVEVIVHEHNSWFACPAIDKNLIHKKGDYKGFRIKSKNGNYYTNDDFFKWFGYKHITHIFSKN